MMMMISFTRDGIFSHQYNPVWADENPKSYFFESIPAEIPHQHVSWYYLRSIDWTIPFSIATQWTQFLGLLARSTASVVGRHTNNETSKNVDPTWRSTQLTFQLIFELTCIYNVRKNVTWFHGLHVQAIWSPIPPWTIFAWPHEECLWNRCWLPKELIAGIQVEIHEIKRKPGIFGMVDQNKIHT